MEGLKRFKPSISSLVFVFAFVSVLSSQNARGAFVNGIERFDGNSKDSGTWEEYTSHNEFLQYDLLSLHVGEGYLGLGDYTTKSITIGVGESVSVEVYDCGYSEVGFAYSFVGLYLTDNSKGTQDDVSWDDDFIGLEWGYYASDQESEFKFTYGGNGGGTGYRSLDNPSAPSFSEPYVFMIERLDSDSARGSVYDKNNMSLLWSKTMYLTHSSYSPIKDELYINLAANVDAVWDNVRIVPEPGSIILFGLGGLLVSARSRFRANP